MLTLRSHNLYLHLYIYSILLTYSLEHIPKQPPCIIIFMPSFTGLLRPGTPVSLQESLFAKGNSKILFEDNMFQKETTPKTFQGLHLIFDHHRIPSRNGPQGSIESSLPWQKCGLDKTAQHPVPLNHKCVQCC